MATRASNRQLRLRRRETEGKYAGLAPTVPSANDRRVSVIVTTWTRSNAAPTSKQPSNHGRAPRTRREEPTTEDHAATQAPLDAIIVAKQKPAPRLSKPRGEDAAIDGEDAIIHQSLSRSRLRENSPKEEKDAMTPPSPDPADLRFPSEAQAVGRRSTPSRRRFQERSRHPRAPPSPAPKKAGAKISPEDAPTTYHHRPPPTRPHQRRPPTI